MSNTIPREYETLFVLNPELAEDAAQKLIERLKGVLTKMGADLLREDNQGKKKFAFMVKKQQRGTFVNLHYVAKAGTVEELERTMRNTEGVLRFLSSVHGEVPDLEAKRAEVDKRIREQEALRAKKEAERAERAAARAEREGDSKPGDDRPTEAPAPAAE